MLGILIGFIMLFAPVVIGPINYMGFVLFYSDLKTPLTLTTYLITCIPPGWTAWPVGVTV